MSSNTLTKRRHQSHRTRVSHRRRRRRIHVIPPIHGNIIKEESGWKEIHIWGSPYQRGFAHGVLLHTELKDVKVKLPFLVEEIEEIPTFQMYQEACKPIQHILKTRYHEIYQELEGIRDGAKSKKVDISVDFLIAWNCLSSMHEIFEDVIGESGGDDDDDDNNNNNRKKSPAKRHKKSKRTQRCSAFIATGNGVTETGEIVMAHNTHIDFIMGTFFHVIMKVSPTFGHEFVMQTCAGYVASASDWFLSASGIIGCETTIGDICYKPEFDESHHPYFCRIRNAMQYANSLEECSQYMLTNNAGDYACSWLFGDTHSNEIMLLEIGLKYHNLQKTKQGIYYGMNSAIDSRLRMIETNDVQLYDYNTSSGSRNIRLESLLYDKYYGKINVANAKKILADHYDISKDAYLLNNNGICNHLYMDKNTEEQFPHGAVDGKVVDSTMARNMQFWGIWGSSCGRAFQKKPFLKRNPWCRSWKKYLTDYPLHCKWIIL
jgi:hypothetical protein